MSGRSPSGLIDSFLTDFDAAAFVANATLPEEARSRDHPFHPVFLLARSAVNNQEIDLAGEGVDAIRDGTFALLEVVGESDRVFKDDDEEREFYSGSREKPNDFSRGMNPVSLMGIPLENWYTESEASPPKPLSRSGAVLARPEPRHPTGELPTWGCPSVTGPRPSVAVEPHDFSRGRCQGMLFAGPIIGYLPNLAYAMSEEGYANAAANAFEALREVSVKALEEDIVMAYESGVDRFVHYIAALDMEEGVYRAVVSEYLSLFASTASRDPEAFISINETTARQVFGDVFGRLAEEEQRDSQYVQMFFEAYAAAQESMLAAYAETYTGLTDEDVMGQQYEEEWTYEEMMTDLVNEFFASGCQQRAERTYVNLGVSRA